MDRTFFEWRSDKWFEYPCDKFYMFYIQQHSVYILVKTRVVKHFFLELLSMYWNLLPWLNLNWVSRNNFFIVHNVFVNNPQFSFCSNWYRNRWKFTNILPSFRILNEIQVCRVKILEFDTIKPVVIIVWSKTHDTLLHITFQFSSLKLGEKIAIL